MLLSPEKLQEFMKHPSPVVRKWAWERMKDIFPEQLEELLPLALNEEDPWVVYKIFQLYRECFYLFSEETLEKLKDKLSISGFSEEEEDISLEMDLQEIGERVMEELDLDLLRKKYPLIRQNMQDFLEGVEEVLPLEDELLEILPEGERPLFQEFMATKKRRKLRTLVEKKLAEMREEVIRRRGELAFRRQLKDPASLGAIFRILETLLELVGKTPSEEEARALARLLLTLLWGKPLFALPENLPPEELLELYLDEKRPLFSEDTYLLEKMTFLVKGDEAFREKVRHRLRELFQENSYGTIRGMWLVKNCREFFFSEFMELYERALREGWPHDYFERIFGSWIKEEEIRRYLLALARKYQKIEVFFLLKSYPTEEVALLLAKNFENWLQEEGLPLIVEAFPHPALWEKVKRYIHPRLMDWESTFLVLAHLFEPNFSGLAELEEEIRKNWEKIETVIEDSKLPTPPFEVSLSCEVCRYQFPFSARMIWLYSDRKDLEIPEKVICPRCGAEDRFAINPREYFRFALLKFLFLEEREDLITTEDGVFLIRGLIGYIDGVERKFDSFQEIRRYYRELIHKRPKDPEVLTGYTQLLLRARRLEEACEILEKLESLETRLVDPLYLRAIYHRLRNEPAKALEFYRRTLEALAGGTPTLRIFADSPFLLLRGLFFEAQDYARSVGEPFILDEKILALVKKKVGRNDPCPCGSGKKYKKCCLPKEKAGLG